MLTVIFDLDGTLIDSAPDLHRAASEMLTGEGRPPLAPEVIRSFIGNGVPVLVERIIAATGLDPAEHARLVETFLAAYNRAPVELTRPYPGVVACLELLLQRGARLGICTNKPEAPAREILELLGLGAHFGAVVGGDSLPTRKPDPAMLTESWRQLGLGPAVYVGDSEVDAETAARAGLPFALFTEGYRKSPVDRMAHDHAFSDFSELPAILERVLAGT